MSEQISSNEFVYAQFVYFDLIVVSFQKTGVTQATIGARSNKSESLSFLLQTSRGRGYQPRTCCTKWMSN